MKLRTTTLYYLERSSKGSKVSAVLMGMRRRFEKEEVEGGKWGMGATIVTITEWNINSN